MIYKYCHYKPHFYNLDVNICCYLETVIKKFNFLFNDLIIFQVEKYERFQKAKMRGCFKKREKNQQMIGLLIIFSSNNFKLYLYCSGACILCRIRCYTDTWFFFNGLSGGRKYCTESFMNSYLLFFFFVFDSALVSVWDLAFIVIDAVHVLNYLCGEKHFNARSLLRGSWNTLHGKEQICRAGSKPHHIKHIKHIFLAKPHCKGAELSQQPVNMLLC